MIAGILTLSGLIFRELPGHFVKFDALAEPRQSLFFLRMLFALEKRISAEKSRCLLLVDESTSMCLTLIEVADFSLGGVTSSFPSDLLFAFPLPLFFGAMRYATAGC